MKHQRRRAQNRASQRAFRHRKDKRMKEIGEQLADLQERHNELTQSYDTLQLEYSAIKEEMETFRRKYESSSISRSYLPVITGWNTQQAELGEQLPFDSSVLLHGPKPGGSQEESGAYDLDSIISK
jgi:AP-1-like factor